MKTRFTSDRAADAAPDLVQEGGPEWPRRYAVSGDALCRPGAT
ncbi:hypothetical protein [Streptosporangium roseum]|nr:hypothetical protein [Streptosporangium roseum]